MKEQSKSKFENIKEAWGNKRYRAIIILGIYFFFFLILIVGIRNTPKVETPTKEESTSFETLTNYEYTYTFSSEEEYIITGERYQDLELIHDKNTNLNYAWKENSFYEIKEGELVPTLDLLNQFHILLLQPSSLSKLISKSTFLYKKEYEENTISTYEISIKDFYSWYDGTYEDSLEMIQISVEEKDYVDKIVIDFTKLNETILTITYSNQNKLTNLEIE